MLRNPINHMRLSTSPKDFRLGQGTRTTRDKPRKFTGKELASIVREVYDLVKYKDMFFAGKSMTSLQLRFLDSNSFFVESAQQPCHTSP